MEINSSMLFSLLEKIREIARVNFEDPDELFHVQLSLKLLDMI
jgi:DNA-binding PucR family transcriptional regulator